MLELMKLECKKNLRGLDYFSIVLIMSIGVFEAILLFTKGTAYECEELLEKAFESSRNFAAFPVLVAGGIAVKLFGKEMRNSYVLPQGRKKLLFSKLMISISVLLVLYISFNMISVSILRSYPNDGRILVGALIITNLVLSISLITILVAIALIFKSETINQIAHIVVAVVAYLIVSIYTSGVPMEQYVGIVIVIAIIALVIFSIAFEKELVRDL